MTTIELLSRLRKLEIRLYLEGDQLRCKAPQGVLTPALRAELSERKSEIQCFLRQSKQDAAASFPPLRSFNRDGQIPLSFAQRRLWRLVQLQPDHTTYNLPLAFHLSGSLNSAAIEQSIAAIIGRHDALRTTFSTVDGEPVQVVTDHAAFSLPIHTLQNEAEAEQQRQVAQHIHRAASTPFDLRRGPLLRATLLKLAEGSHVFVLVMHHIISDGWSFDLFLDELGHLYDAYSQDCPGQLAPLPLQYPDFALWQSTWPVEAWLPPQLAFWERYLGGTLPALALPVDYARSALPGEEGARQPLAFSRELTGMLEAAGKQENATLFMTLLAAYSLLLHSYSGQTDQVLCVPVAGRDHGELTGVIGYFNNLVPLRLDLSGDPTFSTLLSRAREATLAAFEHQATPFDAVASLPGLLRTPLTRGMFNLQTTPGVALRLRGVDVRPLDIHNGTSNFDLSLSLAVTEASLTGVFEYKTSLFKPATVSALQSDFEALLATAAAAPNEPLSALRLPRVTRAPSPSGTVEAARPPAAQQPREPRDEIERKLLQIWETTLQVQPIGMQENFFDLGGHSLLAVQLFEAIKRAFEKQLPLSSILAFPTIERLAEALRGERSVAASSLVAIKAEGTKPPLFCLHDGIGNVLFYRTLARYLAPSQPLFGLQSARMAEQLLEHQTLEDMAAHYVSEVRAVQPEGPYFLLGMCSGGTVALEMAQQLRAQGSEVAFLGAIDSAPLRRPAHLASQGTAPVVDRLREHAHRGTLLRALARFARSHVRRLQRAIRRTRERFRIAWFGSPTQRRLHDMTQAFEATWRSYVPTLYPGNVTFFYSSEFAARPDRQQLHVRWSEIVAGGVETHVLPGQHGTLLQEPHVVLLARQLQACLDAAQQAPLDAQHAASQPAPA